MRAVETSGLGSAPQSVVAPARHGYENSVRRISRASCVPGNLSPRAILRPPDAHSKASAQFWRSVKLDVTGVEGGMPLRNSTPALGAGGGLGQLGSLGVPFYAKLHACSQLTSVLERLELALAEARASGVNTGSVAFRAADTFYSRETSYFAWNRSDPLLPGTCDRVAAEGEAALRQLNAAIVGVGGSTIYTTPVGGGDGTPKPIDWSEALGTVKTVAIAAAIVAGAVAVAPVLAEAAGLSKMFRKAR